MKALVDTNVWLDVILHRQPFDTYSKAFLMACLEDDVEMMIAATSLKDIFYIAEKVLDAEAAYGAVESILELASVSAIDELVCNEALSLEKPNYEDGIIAAAAAADGANFIVTRDESAFTTAKTIRLTPREYLAQAGYEELDLPDERTSSR